MIKRVQRGFIEGRQTDSKVIVIKLAHEINPDKCIVDLRDGLVGSVSEVIISQSLVIKLTANTLQIKLPMIINVDSPESKTGECSWEIIEFE